MRHYAERTPVPVAQSKTEIERLLTAAGASAVGMFMDEARAAVAFKMGPRSYRFVVPMPKPGTTADYERKRAQEHRRKWRALLLVLKAKVESARSGITTLETELLPYAVLPSGATVADEVMPRLAELAGGRDVPLLPGL